MLDGIFASVYGDTITLTAFLICAVISLVLGFFIAWSYKRVADGSTSMSITLAFLPFLVQIVILLVNGNLGAGVAVAGAFSLIRFRSAPGTARDITTIFLGMTVGLACGMGYVVIGILAAIVVCVLMILSQFISARGSGEERELRITIPEDLDYTDVFDDLFAQYTSKNKLLSVKTTDMGSLYKLQYHVCLRSAQREKEFIDQLRCRNGNLEIVCGREPTERL
ncbi:MAG: DUF4956 domain-containing protein [Oscillospiraceae bacterium]|nr:DUF4956 domain-containing protein [Oscillospiraceae bacterium]